MAESGLVAHLAQPSGTSNVSGNKMKSHIVQNPLEPIRVQSLSDTGRWYDVAVLVLAQPGSAL